MASLQKALRRGFVPALALLALLVSAAPAAAQAADLAPALIDGLTTVLPAAADGVAGAAEQGGMQLSTAVEIAVLLTVLTLLPAILVSLTSFTRIVIVLSFVRRSLSVNELPPNPVIIGLALFLTFFVMGPVGSRMYESAYVPYQEGTLSAEAAAEEAWGELRGFLLSNTRESDLELFSDMAGFSIEEDGSGAEASLEEIPFRVVVPSFVLSELKTAFQMGFLLFLPFLVIDLVVASVLISMGMFMLPPVMISTPIKILLFVLVDGWHLLCSSLVTSFVVA